MRLGEGDHGTGHLPWQPRPQARLGRDVDRRQPRHPRLAGLRPSRRCRRSRDALTGRRQRLAGPGRGAHGRAGRHHARPFRPLHKLRQGGRGRFRLGPSGPAEHQAEGSEDLDDRRAADEEARHGGQAHRPQGLRHRRQAAGHAVRGGQGLPGLRGQAQGLRRGKDRRPSGVPRRGQGQRQHARGRRRHLVAGEEGPRRLARSTGTRGRTRRSPARRSPRGSRRASPPPAPMATAGTATPSRRSRARRRRSKPSTPRPSWPMPAWRP